MGVVKAVVFANALREYDADCEQYEDAEPRTPLPRVLVRAARTALVLQLASVFDDGLQEYLSANHPNQRCDRMKNRIEFLKARASPLSRIDPPLLLRNDPPRFAAHGLSMSGCSGSAPAVSVVGGSRLTVA